MSNLNDLTDDFCNLVKLADETYGVDEKCQALITNLKVVHHQVSRSGVGTHSVETQDRAERCLGYLAKAIYEVQAIRKIVNAPVDEAHADTETYNGPTTLRSAQ